MGLPELLRKRYSVRAYSGQPVEREKLERILAAAVLAPTAANKQAFRIHLLPTKGRETELGGVYGRPWFVQPPLVIGVTRFVGKSWVRSDGVDFGTFDCAIVMDHIILAATEEGLGTCWVANFNPEAARKVLGLPEDEDPVIFSPLGYAQGPVPEKKRRTAAELVRRHDEKVRNG